MSEYSDEKIRHILELYKKSRMRDKVKYQNNKLKEGFAEKNRARAKAHYDAHKEVKSTKYKDNRDVLKAKALFNYYKKNEKIDIFKVKHLDKFNLLVNHGFGV